MRSNIPPLGLKCQVRREDLWKLSSNDAWASPGGLGSFSMSCLPTSSPFPCACRGRGFGQGSAGCWAAAGALASAGNELLPSQHPGTSWLGHWDGMFGMSLGTDLALSTSFSLQRWFVGRRIKLGFVRCEHPCWLCSAGLTWDPAGVGTRETLQLLLLLL